MSLLSRYHQAIADGMIQDDSSQRQVLSVLEELLVHLTQDKTRRWFFRWLRKEKGLYIYGPVGRGKTYLMDLFYQALPEKKKARYHFHHFMQQIDTRLRYYQGQANPIDKIAEELLQKATVLCLDELMVTDITQATLLVLLLRYLFKKGVILVVTSNIRPDDLYLNGVNRERFLPAIEMVKKYCRVIALYTPLDYRRTKAQPIMQQTFFPSLDQQTNDKLRQLFILWSEPCLVSGVITIQKRDIPYIMMSHRAIWFDFKTICAIPRCQLDYLELAEKFEIFFISQVPVLSQDDTTQIILFMYLIDVLYDKKRQLVLSSAVDIERLYPDGPMLSSFERTLSRLSEMRSTSYLGFGEPGCLD